MSRLPILCTIVCAVLCLLPSYSQAQVTATLPDTGKYRPLSVADSLRMLDSLYAVRRKMVERWTADARNAPRPQDDFLSVYLGIGGLMKIRANDLNEYFAQRVYRPNPSSDRDQLSTVDRAFIVSGQAQLTRTWGIYVEYDYLAHDYNSIVDSALPGIKGAEEVLDYSQHSLVTGGMVILYNTQFYRLRATGGLGAVFARTYESESSSGATRSASSIGYQFNIDLNNDFRFVDWATFTIDFLSRSATTGTLKTSDGQSLSAPFGKHTSVYSLSPRASNLTFGFAVGVAFYF